MIYSILIWIALVASVTPFLVGLFTYRRLSKEMKLLVVYFALGSITNFIMVYLTSRGYNNLWILHVFPMVEYSLLVLVFSYWQKEQIVQKAFRWSIPVFIIVGIIMMLIQDLRQSNNLGISIEGVILIGIAAFTLFEITKESVSSLLTESRFWIGLAVLMYFLGTTIFFALSNVILNLPVSLAQLIWTCKNVFEIATNFIFVKGLLCQFRAQKSYGS